MLRKINISLKKIYAIVIEGMMQKDKKIDAKLMLSSVLLILFLIFSFLNLGLNQVFLVTSILLMIATIFISYYFYLKILEGLPKKLFDSYNIDIKEKNTLKCSLEIVKFNVQTLHSFLVMGIAVITLIFSLYGLYTKVIDSQKVIPYAILLISLANGLIIAILIINCKWFIKYNKLMITRPEETKIAEEIKQSDDIEIDVKKIEKPENKQRL